MKVQTDEMKKLSHAVGSLVPPVAPAGRPRHVSVASKKHKLDEYSEEVFFDAPDNTTKKENQREPIKTFANVVVNGKNRITIRGNTSNQSMGNTFRTKKHSTLLFGSAKTDKDNTENFLAANVNLVATGVAKDATADQLKNFIVAKGINVEAIELLTSHPDARTNTFKIVIKACDFERAMSPDVWPYRVGVRMFKHKRTQNTWSNQAGQTGGNIQQELIILADSLFILLPSVTLIIANKLINASL